MGEQIDNKNFICMKRILLGFCFLEHMDESNCRVFQHLRLFSQRKKCFSKIIVTSSNNPDIFCRIHSNRDKQLLRCGQTVEMPLLYEPAVTDLIRNSFDIFLTLRCNVSCFIF